MKKIGLLLIVALSGCATLNNSISKDAQIIQSNSTLINGCKKLGPIHVDTQALNFQNAANNELQRQAARYGADSVAITNKQALPLGHIIIDGTALKCYE
ncbi:hypothetical protein [Acinetobacter sp. ANC 4640]